MLGYTIARVRTREEKKILFIFENNSASKKQNIAAKRYNAMAAGDQYATLNTIYPVV